VRNPKYTEYLVHFWHHFNKCYELATILSYTLPNGQLLTPIQSPNPLGNRTNLILNRSSSQTTKEGIIIAILFKDWPNAINSIFLHLDNLETSIFE
jgi:hypothetical protein